MKRIISKLVSSTPQPILPPSLALRKVTSKSGNGIYASTDTLFKGAVFGRDSIEVAEDIITFKPRLVKRIILTLAAMQGEAYKSSREEEPGKILHEYRSVVVDGRRVQGVSKQIFDELSSKWGGDESTLIYYGSIDSTPHFVRLVGSYTQLYGNKILKIKVLSMTGVQHTLNDVLDKALNWIERKLKESHSGLLEYKKRTLSGIDNQVWKDSKEFYVHENKNIVNHDTPVASIEVQGLVYDAFLAAARLRPELADHYQKLANNLRDKTIELLWLEDRNYFALGIDYDETSHLRQITTPTSNPAELLDTQIFDGLPTEKRKVFVSAIVKKIMGRDFLTDGGIRSRALSGAHLIPFWDYHGSFTTWPKETYDIAKGLRRQGFPLLARQLENRIINVALKSAAYPEFFFVDEWGRVLTNKTPAVHGHGEVVMIDSNNTPERIQAWTVSAVLGIVARRIKGKVGRTKHHNTEKWQQDLEKNIMAGIPKVERLINPFALAARYPTYQYKLIKETKHNI